MNRHGERNGLLSGVQDHWESAEGLVRSGVSHMLLAMPHKPSILSYTQSQALAFAVSGNKKMDQVPGQGSCSSRGKGRVTSTKSRKTHQNQESELEVIMRVLPHSPKFKERREREVVDLEGATVGILPTFKLLYPLRLLQYQQLMRSKMPRITIRKPIPAALAREIDKSILVQKPYSRLW